jgi:hypothetical protein
LACCWSAWRLQFHRPVAHVLQRQRRGDHQHFVQCAALARLQDHAAHARVERQARELRAHGRERVVVVHRAQLVEQLVAVADGPSRGPVDEGELLHRAQGSSDFMRRITPASDERRISGSVKRGGPRSPSGRTAGCRCRSATRPQRPARWLAAAWLHGSTSSCSTLLRKL